MPSISARTFVKAFMVMALSLGAGPIASKAALAQARIYATPAGGMTVKNVVMRKDGYAFFTVVETVSELSSCPAWVHGPTSYAQPLWIDMAQPSGKQLYASVLAASLTGKKIAAVSFDLSTDCWVFVVRIDP